MDSRDRREIPEGVHTREKSGVIPETQLNMEMAETTGSLNPRPDLFRAETVRASPPGHKIVALGGPGLGYEVHRWPWNAGNVAWARKNPCLGRKFSVRGFVLRA